MKKILIRSLLTFSTLFLQNEIAFAQNESQPFEPHGSLTIDVCVPEIVSNKSYRKLMQGLIFFSPYYQYRFKNKFTVGGGLNVMKVNADVATISAGNGGSELKFGGFLKTGYEVFYNSRFGMDYGVRFGYNQSYYITAFTKKIGTENTAYSSYYVMPMLGLVLTVDKANSYRLNIGYAVENSGFSPQHIGETSNLGLDPLNFGYPSNYLFIGFGYTKYFGYQSEDEE